MMFRKPSRALALVGAILATTIASCSFQPAVAASMENVGGFPLPPAAPAPAPASSEGASK